MSIMRTRVSRSRTTTLALGVLTIAVALPVLGTSTARAATAVPVTVNATAGLGAIPSNAIGLNTAVYDGHMNDAAMPALLKTAGFDALRYPGGSYSDIFNWQTNVAQGGYDAPNTSFSDFMGTAQAAGTNPIITVNYGTGTPALAAAWVQKRDDLPPHGGFGVIRVDQGDEIGRDVHAEQIGSRKRLALAIGQFEDLLEFVGGVQPMRKLPAPVIPFVIRYILINERTF